MGDRKRDVVGLAISMPILATLAVAFRFQSRIVKRAGLGADDFLVLAALIFCIALSVVVLVAVYGGGLGSHLVFIEYEGEGVPADVDAFVLFSKMLWVVQWLSVGASGLTKLSVLFLYRRIFVTRSFQIVCWAMIGLCTVWLLGFFFGNLLDCLPFELNWHPTAGVSGRCIDIIKMFWAFSITDILTDVMILSLPWRQIWKLNMPLGKKLQVGAIFLLGFFVVGAGIARLVVSAPAVLGTATDLDYTYSRVPAVYWSVVMVCVGVISACLPTVRPLFGYYGINESMSSLRHFLRSSRSSTTLALSEKKGTEYYKVKSDTRTNSAKSAQPSVDIERSAGSEDSSSRTLQSIHAHDSEILVMREWGHHYEAT